jgi:GAF domain-containing protein
MYACMCNVLVNEHTHKHTHTRTHMNTHTHTHTHIHTRAQNFRTLCGWSLAFKNPQVLVIPDTHKDARFANNKKVVDGPKIRFYCGAPLVAFNGHRLGTL